MQKFSDVFSKLSVEEKPKIIINKKRKIINIENNSGNDSENENRNDKNDNRNTIENDKNDNRNTIENNGENNKNDNRENNTRKKFKALKLKFEKELDKDIFIL